MPATYLCILMMALAIIDFITKCITDKNIIISAPASFIRTLECNSDITSLRLYGAIAFQNFIFVTNIL